MTDMTAETVDGVGFDIFRSALSFDDFDFHRDSPLSTHYQRLSKPHGVETRSWRMVWQSQSLQVHNDGYGTGLNT